MAIKHDKWQKDFLGTKGDKILNCGRQIGKSEICGEDAGEFATSHPKVNVLMIAPTERQSYLLFDKTYNWIYANHRNLIKRGKDRPTKSKIQLKNGSTIWCLPTGLSGTGIRGLTVHRLYADEASRIPEEVWVAVTPMLLTTGGDMILLSTPFGRQGFFYDVLINKDEAFNTFTRFETTSLKVIEEREICESWTEIQRTKAIEKIEQAKARMTTMQFQQEYEGRFVDDINQFFSDELIKQCMTARRAEPILNQKYYCGVDVAGRGDDENTMEVMMKIDDKMVQVENKVEINNLTTMTTRSIIKLDRKFDFQKIFIDDGGLGFGVFSELLENEQTRRKTVPINNASRPLDKDESRKKKILKEDLYNNLLSMMEKGKVALLDDPEIFQSLKSVQFSYEDNKFKIFGDYTHIAEGLIRACWGIKEKELNIRIHYI